MKKYLKALELSKSQAQEKILKSHLEMEENEIPVAQRPRHVPYYLEEPLKQWIEQGVEENIFEKVPAGEDITWCSPLVVQPKPKFAKGEDKEAGVAHDKS